MAAARGSRAGAGAAAGVTGSGPSRGDEREREREKMLCESVSLQAPEAPGAGRSRGLSRRSSRGVLGGEFG